MTPQKIFVGIAVIGRALFDEEDSIYTFRDCTEDAAVTWFREELNKELDCAIDYFVAAQDREIIINAVLTSAAPINVTQYS